VVCSFCPRLYDYHPKAIPAPYNHSNIDSDEVIYYVDGDFMSRNDIAQGHMTLHPGGIPARPHTPGAMERSIGKKRNAGIRRYGRHVSPIDAHGASHGPRRWDLLQIMVLIAIAY